MGVSDWRSRGRRPARLARGVIRKGLWEGAGRAANKLGSREDWSWKGKGVGPRSLLII